MKGASDVEIASPCSTISGPLVVALMPLMHCSVKFREAEASKLIDCRRLWVLTGIITLISKLPDCSVMVIVVWVPFTCAQAMETVSAITRLTLPGMIELG